MRVPDAAVYVGVSPSLMKRWISEKKVSSIAVGGVRLVHRTSLDRLVGGGEDGDW
jgi:excisionase family DNA binding protein